MGEVENKAGISGNPFFISPKAKERAELAMAAGESLIREREGLTETSDHSTKTLGKTENMEVDGAGTFDLLLKLVKRKKK